MKLIVLAGHQIGLRWLQQNHFDMRTVTYVWLGFLLTVLCAVCLITAFNNRHMVSSLVHFLITPTNYDPYSLSTLNEIQQISLFYS